MMKKTRHRLSVVALTAAMLLSLFAPGVFAQEPEPSAEYEYDSAVAFAQEPEPDTEYEYGSAAAEVTSAEKEYRSWATGDSRWKDLPLGKNGKTVAEKGSTVVAVSKIIMQAGLNKEPDFNVATYVTWLNEHNGFIDGMLAWTAAARYSADLKYAGVKAYGDELNSADYTEKILAWLKEGNHLVIASSGYHWFAVDEGRSLATGQVYIMDSRTIATEYNTGMLLTETYPTISSINAYTGGTTHTHSLKENLEPATCESRGYLELECTSCGESYLADILTPLGHATVETKVAPTCIEKGYTLLTCTRCSYSEKTDYTDLTVHEYTKKKVDPTCTEKGYTLLTCTRCGYSEKTDYTDPTGHVYEETKVEATCTAQGYTLCECTKCGYSEKTNFIPALSHDFKPVVVDATETEKGYTRYQCFRCPYSYIDASSYVDPHAHSWSKWKIIEASTASSYGKRSCSCTVSGCSAAKSENIPWLCPFTDVSAEQYYYTPVIWAAGRTPRITAGTTLTTFSPDQDCTRAQVVSFLWRAMGSPAPSGTNPFTDVKTTDYYYKAVLWASQNGITFGTTPTTFSPTASVTRAQFVTFLYRMAGKPSATGSNPFVDITSDKYYYKAVLWASQKGITYGMDDKHFMPDRFCTRAQVVSFLYRYLGE